MPRKIPCAKKKGKFRVTVSGSLWEVALLGAPERPLIVPPKLLADACPLIVPPKLLGDAWPLIVPPKLLPDACPLFVPLICLPMRGP